MRAIALIGQRLYRARNRHFGTGLFGDPAWEIVQLLLAEDGADIPLSFAQILDTLDISPDVLQRYLKLLAAKGIVVAPWPNANSFVLSRTARERLRMAFRDAGLVPE